MPNALISLPYDFISIKGDDAEKFLQGQTSCDVSALDEQHASFGTTNSPKGRMYGLFLVIRIENGFLLRMHKTTSELFLAQLGKYKVFFKCEMQREPAIKAYGQLDAERAEDFSVRRDADDWIVQLPGDVSLAERWSSSDQIESEDDQALWHSLECKNGLPELYDCTQDQFILQYLNLQHLNAVSFNKGCYTGQEIIARMKFLGKLKKQTFLLLGTEEKTSTAGSPIFDDTGKKCGELVRSHWHPEHGSVALGILDISYREEPKPVYLDEAQKVAFQVAPLDYN